MVDRREGRKYVWGRKVRKGGNERNKAVFKNQRRKVVNKERKNKR